MIKRPIRSIPGSSTAAGSPVGAVAVLGAVREDVRHTLRTGWLDPALDAATASPVFFTAAWSAIRPNVGRSFLQLASSLRAEAAEALSSSVGPLNLRSRICETLPEYEVRRVEESARATHQSAAKVQIVIHALYRAVVGERIGGTGQEEPSVRRGIPDWQRWISLQPVPPSAQAPILDAMSLLGLPCPPTWLRLFGRWPSVVDVLWGDLKGFIGSDLWRSATARVRRLAFARISSLPHPVELQWAALKERGFTERDRIAMADALAAHDAAMPVQTLASAFIWLALGSPEVSFEG